MLDYVDYTIEVNHHQGNGNGANPLSYDRLESDWALFYKVAKYFVRKVKPEDRHDFLHDLLLEMAKVKAKYQVSGKLLTEAGLMRVAAYEVSAYWRKQYKLTNGFDCGRCSKAQRQKCRSEDLYSKCPKAIRLESLNQLIDDGNGDKTELYQMLADDNAIDLVAMLDTRHTLKTYPRRLVQIAYKRYAGYRLTDRERNYLYQRRKKVQKGLAFI